MTDHTHEFPQLTTRQDTPILLPCRICNAAPSEVLATLVAERDARLGQVYELLDVVAEILQTRARRASWHAIASRDQHQPKTARRTNRTRRTRG
jgi:hypothetical protein